MVNFENTENLPLFLFKFLDISLEWKKKEQEIFLLCYKLTERACQRDFTGRCCNIAVFVVELLLDERSREVGVTRSPVT